MDTKYIILSVVIIVAAIFGGYELFGGNGNISQVSLVTTTATTTVPVTAPVATSTQSAQTTSMQNGAHKVTIKTNYGTIVFETYDADAPNTVQNFITLADKGFYNGLIFHRVISGFMIQGGDPNCSGAASNSATGACGTGGPGYQFADELNPATASYQAGYKAGVVAMANSGPNTNGSQFFIMAADYPLPNNYTIFGKVISGQDVVSKIDAVKTDSNNKPLTPVVMKSVTVSAND
jgi:cyclophilin family peptidyl-prolyl cis-trans isomerase